MLLQVIPYVADQFEPGTYVFDGENLSGSHLFKTSGPVSVYSITQSNFNTESILSSGATQSTYYLEDQEFKKVAMLYSLDATILGEFVADATISTVTTSNYMTYLVGSESKQMQADPVLEVTYSTVFFSQINEQIDKALGPSEFVPRILDTRTLKTPASLGVKLLNGESIWTTATYFEGQVSFDIDAESAVASRDSTLDVAGVSTETKPVSFMNVIENEVPTTSFKFVSPVGLKFIPSGEPSNNPHFSM